jgi:transcriptional regulator with XRE-family HTH domain
MRPVPHPAKGVLAVRRITIRDVAAHLGYSPTYISKALNGWHSPSPRLRAGIAEMVGLPESALFRDEWLKVTV